MTQRLKKGMRVRCTSFLGPVPRGTTGTIVEHAPRTIYCDAFQSIEFVRWDNRKQARVSKWHLEAVREEQG
jgi:hypothetical protein